MRCAAGDAVSSNCFGYEVGGAIVLLLLGLAVFAFVLAVSWAIRKRRVVWAGVSVRATWKTAKEEWVAAKARGSAWKRLQGYYDAHLILYTRGDWEQVFVS